jgi:hypothetical protein
MCTETDHIYCKHTIVKHLHFWNTDVQCQVHQSRAMAQAVSRGGPGSIPAQSMCDLWWSKWHWDRFFPEFFGFPLSISFHRCSIIRKRTKNNHHHLHLHNKPHGCSASVASAAGPFTTKKIHVHQNPPLVPVHDTSQNTISIPFPQLHPSSH